MTVDEKFDVSIVGGGPAGAAVAQHILANDEISVAIYDRRDPVGRPVNCAGGIVSYWLEKIGIDLPDSVIANEIRGLRIIGPDGCEWAHHNDDINESDSIGVVMYRDKFDQWNLDRALGMGAVLKSPVDPSKFEEPYTFPGSKYVIGADGWRSGMAEHIGLDMNIAAREMHIGYEHRVITPEYDQDYITFYLGHEWAPGGYVWAFPEGGDIVKIGLGIQSDAKHNCKYYLKQFLRDFPMFDGERTERKASGAGFIPTCKPMENFVKQINGSWYGIVGDAARQVDPLHGGGISTAILAGQICGDVIAISGPLSMYQTLWDKEHKPEHLRRWAMKEALLSWDDEKINKMVTTLHGFKFETSRAPVEAAKMILHLVKNVPGMFSATLLKALYGYAKATF